MKGIKGVSSIIGGFGLCALILGAGSVQVPSRYSVTIPRERFAEHVRELRARDIDVAGTNLSRQTVTLLVDDKEKQWLESQGWVGDQAFAPALPLVAPDSKYKTPEQVEALLKNYAATYPEIATVSSVGRSLEGRDIYALKITKNKGQQGRKPAVLFNGMHHAREVMSVEVPLDIIDYLLTNYGQDAKVTHWVDSFEIHVLPMLNVDGNHRVWTLDSWWRKNVRGGFGVDINRNYPFAWNACNGSSQSSSAQDYRGQAPASEPETNTLMQLVAAVRPVFDISFHSYSELVIYPYGCGAHTETKEIVEPLGQELASLIKTDDGQGTYKAGTAPDLLYHVDGDDISWMYHEQHVIPYVIEVNSSDQGFQPAYDQWRDSTVARVRPAWQHLLERLDGPSLTGSVGEAATLKVERLDSQSRYQESFKTRQDGSFHAILNPGKYKVTLVTQSGRVIERQVRIGRAPLNMIGH